MVNEELKAGMRECSTCGGAYRGSGGAFMIGTDADHPRVLRLGLSDVHHAPLCLACCNYGYNDEALLRVADRIRARRQKAEECAACGYDEDLETFPSGGKESLADVAESSVCIGCLETCHAEELANIIRKRRQQAERNEQGAPCEACGLRCPTSELQDLYGFAATICRGCYENEQNSELVRRVEQRRKQTQQAERDKRADELDTLIAPTPPPETLPPGTRWTVNRHDARHKHYTFELLSPATRWGIRSWAPGHYKRIAIGDTPGVELYKQEPDGADVRIDPEEVDWPSYHRALAAQNQSEPAPNSPPAPVALAPEQSAAGGETICESCGYPCGKFRYRIAACRPLANQPTPELIHCSECYDLLTPDEIRERAKARREGKPTDTWISSVHVGDEAGGEKLTLKQKFPTSWRERCGFCCDRLGSEIVPTFTEYWYHPDCYDQLQRRLQAKSAAQKSSGPDPYSLDRNRDPRDETTIQRAMKFMGCTKPNTDPIAERVEKRREVAHPRENGFSGASYED